MIKFIEPFYVYYADKWTLAQSLTIYMPQQTHKLIQIKTEQKLYENMTIYLQNIQYQISTNLEEFDRKSASFNQILYNIIKIRGRNFTLIIASRDSNIEKMQNTKLLYKLIYYTKFLKNTITKDVGNNFYDSIYQAFLTIIKKKFKTKDSKISSKLVKFFQNIIIEEQQPIKDQEITNIVYKAILYHGLFPIQIRLKYSNYNYLIQQYHKIRYQDQTPWNCGLDSEIKIGREFYCDYNRIDYIRTAKPFIKLRILDFFPLDQWILGISEWFKENLNSLIQEFKQNFKQQDQSTRNFNINSSYNTTTHKSNIGSLTQPLLMMKSAQSIQNSYKQMIFKIIQSRKYNLSILIDKLSQDFYEFYKKELFQSKIFKRVSIVVGDNINKQGYFFQNPNELVSTITYIFHDLINKIAQPLTLSLDLKKSFDQQVKQFEIKADITEIWKIYAKKNNELFKLYTKFSTDKQLINYICPSRFQSLIDYFGFFTDTKTKELFENLKTIDHNTFSFFWESSKDKNKNQIKHFQEQFQYSELLSKSPIINICLLRKNITNIHFLIYYHMNQNGQKHKEMCKSLLYWYYNSIRLKNQKKYKKIESCIGNVLIKSPHKL